MNDELFSLRNKITKIDRMIVELLEKRINLVKEISKVKKKNGFNIEDKSYEKKMIEARKKFKNLSGDFVEKLFELIIKESKRVQYENQGKN